MHCTIRFEHPKSLRMDRVLENGVIEKESSRWFPNGSLGTSGHRWLRGTGGPMNPKPIGGFPFKVSEEQKSRENRWVRQDPPRFSLGAKR
uniref:Uncharacterized protein n=1 Tax=Candidatus Kentrum sp. LFY TaxID=2126342 RepID=A0A450UMW4_9GAMM|nr:MAG: hypothetical protein BECKLFY1418A_GA0070994_10357 [Candidatus Kentron sp. LFY]